MRRTVRAAVTAVVAGALAGCLGPFEVVEEVPGAQQASDAASAWILAGEISFAQPAFLPEDAVARVTLVRLGPPDQAPAPLITVEIPAEPPPFGFLMAIPQSLRDDPGQLALDAEIADANGRVLWAADEPSPVDADRGARPLTLRVSPAPSLAAGTLTPPVGYSCEGLRLSVAGDDGVVRVSFPEGQRVLTRQRSASGSKFADGDTVFWRKGRTEALVAKNGGDFRECVATTPIADLGAGIEAHGDQPFWYLRVLGEDGVDGMQLALGAHTPSVIRTQSARRESVDHTTVRYRSEADDGQVVVIRIAAGGRCRGDGKRFPLNVQVRVGELRYRGCGRRLEP